jgi:chromosome segregation ATPase
LKEQYESDLKEIESLQNELKKKLKDARIENQMCEDTISQLRTQISQLQGELTSYQQVKSSIF